MVQRQAPPGAEPGFLQERLRSPVRQSGAAERIGAPALRVRPEDRQVGARRHLLLHAPPILRPRRQKTLWTSAGGPQSGVVGWVNTQMFLETGDSAKSQGWTPIIGDT